MLRTGSWFLDLDIVWLRPCLRTPSTSGHVFASMHAVDGLWTGNPNVHWKTKFVRRPGEKLWLAIPFFFPFGSQVLASALAACEGRIQIATRAAALGSMPYLFVMTAVKKALHKEAPACPAQRPGMVMRACVCAIGCRQSCVRTYVRQSMRAHICAWALVLSGWFRRCPLVAPFE